MSSMIGNWGPPADETGGRARELLAETGDVEDGVVVDL